MTIKKRSPKYEPQIKKVSVMDNPNVSINDLFASAQKSWIKYENKQQSNFANADTKPLFGSLLKPAYLDKEGQEKSKNKESKTAPDYAALLETSISDIASDALKVSMTESKVGPHLHNSLEFTEKPSPSTASAIEETSSSNQDGARIPEYVPQCEIRRREAVAASLRASFRKLNASKLYDRNFKPLSWETPSFHFPSNPNVETNKSDHTKQDGESSSSSIQLGKRKERSSAIDAPITNYCGLETIMPRPLGARPPSAASSSLPQQQRHSNREEGINRSNSITSYNHYPHSHYRREWPKEEVDGLVAFAKKWITPDMNKRPKR